MIINLTFDYNLSLELRRIELRTSRMQSEHSTAELQPLGTCSNAVTPGSELDRVTGPGAVKMTRRVVASQREFISTQVKWKRETGDRIR